MNYNIIKILRDEIPEIEILENSDENNLVIKSEYTIGLLLKILYENYDISENELNYDNITEFIRIESGLYIIIIDITEYNQDLIQGIHELISRFYK